MDNQQPSNLTGIQTLARNAKFGDGYYWKHPECVNYKIIFTSTDKGLLKKKMGLCPSLFPSGVSLYRKGGAVTNYCTNSKPLYKLTSLVHPIFTIYYGMPKETVLPEMTLFDFALWYLDDGSYIARPPRGHRFMIHIGDAATGNNRKAAFLSKVRELFGHIKTRGNSIGFIIKNNSKATENNLTWKMPVPYGLRIIQELKHFYVIPNKFPKVEGSETIPYGSTTVGRSSRKRRQLHM
ncbi:MAG: hypothetical protein DRO67_00425 [Candidatus Asgardarchaeum californiense]|nr:MAG: hypothetical protein DRO67_00425 [Candidatus Asgardarchaeum californiense]